MKKIPIIPLLGLLVPVLLAAAAAFADAGADLKQAEGLYQAGQYTQAEQAYLAAIKEADPNKPADVEAAFNARKKLASVYIATDRLPQAQAAVVQLLARHSQHERLPHVMHEIVEEAKASGKALQAGQICQAILTAQPEHPEAIWLKMGIAVANVHLGDDKAVDSVLQNIIAQHTADDRAAEALGQTAWAYRKLGQDDKARTVYQYVVDNWPKKDRTIFSQRGLILCSLAMDDQSSAAAGMQRLMTEYADSRYMPEIVRNIAVYCGRTGKSKQAVALHQYVVDKYPASLEALWCQRDLVFCHIDEANEPATEAALQKLVSGFAGQNCLAEALADIGEYYRKKGNFQNARLLHRQVVNQFPGSEEAVQSQRNLILSDLGLSDDPQIKTDIQTLLVQFSGNKDIVPVVCYVADRLGYGRDEERLQLYQYIIDQHPKHELVIRAKAKLGQMRLLQGDEQGAEAIFSGILADYANHPRLPEGVHLMADGYYLRACADMKAGRKEEAKDHFEKTVVKCRIITEQLPPAPDVTPEAYYTIGCIYLEELRQYKNALEYFTTLVDKWPEWEEAYHAQFKIARCWEQLLESHQVLAQDAIPMIVESCEQLLARYPNCKNMNLILPYLQRWQEIRSVYEGGRK